MTFILSANVARRHMSKGALAMVTERARRLGAANESRRAAAKKLGMSNARLDQAASIIDFAPDLADGVSSRRRSKPTNPLP